MQTDGADATDPAPGLVLDAAAVLYAGGQSTGMTLAAVDRLNEGLGTTGTLVPTWASLQLVGSGGAVRVAAGSPTGVNMRRVAATMTVVDRAQDGPLDADEARDQRSDERLGERLTPQSRDTAPSEPAQCRTERGHQHHGRMLCPEDHREGARPGGTGEAEDQRVGDGLRSGRGQFATHDVGVERTVLGAVDDRHRRGDPPHVHAGR